MAPQNVLIIGGAGAQGVPIVRALSSDPRYAVCVLTRNPDSETAKELLTLPNVTLAIGDASNEADLRAAFQGISLAFVNTNSNALGIRAEMYWGTRIFEIAIESGVQHYIWSSLEDTLALSGYDEACRVGHYAGKSRVAEWMCAFPQSPMKWSVITTGPYIEMLHELFRPRKEEDGTRVFGFPLKDGAIPFVHLDDVANGVKWLFDHPEEAAGKDLKMTVEHASGKIIAEAFEKVTGQKARYEDISKEDWYQRSGIGPLDWKMGEGYEGNRPEDPTLLSVEQNFGNWWNLYQRSAGNKGLIKTDYEELDRILPHRVKSVEAWMTKVGYTGEA
ncbi:hypothetical protein BCR34DRAFT_435259, partial [Clohesyomyces aquaticus]